ncbi:hypothetical protein TSUD_118870 [Trifolium subterraneum]|uniref:Uncharacterized protein n=1 Tax=Trifolium subterraneum TaxID=3900 RepID=A0A2Z6NB12_TRISU|nr:hypothetical protein TSUD_118870 [Trifolium subterraneum]
MAELIAGAFLSSFFQFAFERLASSDFKDLFHKGLVKKLEITLNSINQLLDDAETKQYQNSRVKNWLDELKHEVYEVDQLLDEIATNVQGKSKGKRFLLTFTNPFESRIKDLLGKLNFLAEQKDVLGLKEGRFARNELEVGPKSSIRIPMTSLVDESSICGRKGDKEKIINFLLLDNGSSNRAPIISIVGLGGMGKTTLAQLVYNDHTIQKSFNLKGWIYVSESFDVVGLTKAIIESFGCSPTSENLEPLQLQLQERLTGKKYLLVLDDVWNGNGEIWERFLLPFNKGSSGSKLIVTTRDKEVAISMKSSMLFDLERLEESDSWSLFVKLAFHNRNVSEYPILESIGKNIVAKCGGLPLAVKTLGNLLQKKFSESQWKKILETDLWYLSERDSNINPVLRLSYHNLPSNMKRCFAYCSIFPKGYEFEKNTLINLWKAEGLLNCCRGDKSDEELGNELFNDLESISFFQQSPYFAYDKSFVMHDLVNDLAKSESLQFCLQIDGDKVHDICEKTRHIWFSLDLNDDARISKQLCKIKGLRSLFVKRRAYYGERIMISNHLQCDIFSKLKYLRMLSFRGCKLSELADEIGKLKLLRYLDLTSTEIKSLPDSICELYNLETLILKGTYIKKMPKKIGRLNHLQTLSHFVVAEKRGCDIKELGSPLLKEVSISKCPELKRAPLPQHLPSLQKLKIVDCEMLEISIPKGDSMIELHLEKCDWILVNELPTSLKKFVLLKNRYVEFSEEQNLVNCTILEELEFDLKGIVKHPSLDLRCYNSLRELSIKGCDSSSFSWPFSLYLFTNLQQLRLYDFPQLESFPRGGLPSKLRWLTIEKCPKLIGSREEWGLFQLNSLRWFTVSDEFENVESFPEENLLPPTLNDLTLTNCSKLRIMNYKGFIHLNSLQGLDIKNCPSLESLPEEGLPSLLLWISECPIIREKYKKEGGERWHTIRHIPFVDIDNK